MNIASITWTSLFGVGILYTTGILVQVGGYFPRKARPNPLKGAGNAALISILLSLSLTLFGLLIFIAINKLPLTSAFIAGGLGFLLAPILCN